MQYGAKIFINKSSSILLSLILLISLFSANSHADNWRKVATENTVLMTLPQGKVVIELAPFVAPKHVEQFLRLAKQGFYRDNRFYRVIDGFVAQAGPPEDSIDAPNLLIESEWHPDKSWSWLPVQKNDMFAAETGFYQGFATGYDAKSNTAWLTHCPGVLAMARGNDANSGSSHFYFTIGQAPRYLDRIMTIFGRVVYGMDKIQSIKRTAVIEGEANVPAKDFTPILNLQRMVDVPKKDQIMIEVQNTDSEAFKKSLIARKERKSEFFYKKPPPVLDVCQVPVRSRLAK
jgi:peptidylprolyl isomerase